MTYYKSGMVFQQNFHCRHTVLGKDKAVGEILSQYPADLQTEANSSESGIGGGARGFLRSMRYHNPSSVGSGCSVFLYDRPQGHKIF